MDGTDCQPWLKEVIDRYEAFFADPTPGGILVKLSTWDVGLDYASRGVEGRRLDSWDFERDAEAYAEYCVRRLRAERELTGTVADDRVPSVSASLGIAPYSAFLSGADVILGEETSWVHPVVNDWADADALRIDPGNKWVDIIQRITRRLVELAEGDYTVHTFNHFAPMDFAGALRGNDLFLDLFDEPEKVHELMESCARATLWMEEEQRKIVPQVRGGTCIWGTWMPGRAIFMSEDTSDLCSPEIYARFGRPHTDRISEACGGAWIHHHAKGLHVHREIARVGGLRFVEMSLDPNCDRPVDHLEELFEWNDGVPLMTRCRPQDVYDKIDVMKQGRLVLELKTGDMKEAAEAVAFIRKHSRIG